MPLLDSYLPKIKEIEEKICDSTSCSNLDKLRELHDKLCSDGVRSHPHSEINTSATKNLQRLQQLNSVLASKEDPSF